MYLPKRLYSLLLSALLTAVCFSLNTASAETEVSVKNGSFEEGTEGWTASPLDAAASLSVVSQEAAHEGSNGLRVKQDTEGPGSWFQSGKNPIEAEKSYRFSFWSRCLTTSGIGVWIQFFDAQGKNIPVVPELAIQVKQDAKDWTQYSKETTSPAGAASFTLAVHAYSKRVCEADFDDFTVTPIASTISSSIPSVASILAAVTLPPADPARVKEIASFLDPIPKGVGPSLNDRAAWDALGAEVKLKDQLISRAEKFFGEPIPEVSKEAYALSGSTGDRKIDEMVTRRRFRLANFVLAEGIENKGRFLTPIENEINAICSEPSWILSGHVKFIKWNDLGTAMTAWNLSTAVSMLGERLSSGTREKVVAEVRKRVIEPFLDQVRGKTSPPEFWRNNPNNWNAVVHSGIVGAALVLDDSVEERAEIIANAEKYTDFYIKGFPSDGYSTEGMGYWKYGFGHYIMLSETVLAATKGHVNLYDKENIKLIAQFPRRFAMAPAVYPAYSDAIFMEEPSTWLFHIIDHRYGLGDQAPKSLALDGTFSAFLYAYGINMAFDSSAASLVNDGTPAEKGHRIRDWFEESQVLVGRLPEGREGLGFSFKGGNNGTSHGHNDLGSFVVTVSGQPLLVDPGSTPYNGNTFGPHRYENQVINSYGHSVPKVAGQTQKEGAQYYATVAKKSFSDVEDSVVLDLTKAYNVPSLTQLTRHYVYGREGNGTVSVTDQGKFSSPQLFGTALITYGEVSEEKPGVWIVSQNGKKARVEIEAGGAPFTVTNEILKDQARAGKVRRLGIDLKSVTALATITMRITPVL
ncbi:MAG: carbohydrate binding domain-containing protein [Chthoniobacterales bacterium]